MILNAWNGTNTIYLIYLFGFLIVSLEPQSVQETPRRGLMEQAVYSRKLFPAGNGFKI